MWKIKKMDIEDGGGEGRGAIAVGGGIEGR